VRFEASSSVKKAIVYSESAFGVFGNARSTSHLKAPTKR